MNTASSSRRCGKGSGPILQKIIGSKEIKMIYDSGAAAVKNVPVPAADRARFALSEDEILTARALGLHHRRALQRETPHADADGYRMGERRPNRASFSSSRRDRKRCSRAGTRMSSSFSNLKVAAKFCSPAAASARKSPAVRCV